MRLGVKIGILSMLLITLVVMIPALKGGFFFDDEPNIVDNPAIHVTQLNIDSLKQSLNGPHAGPLGRPVSILSIALTYYFFGLDAFAFKTINLLIHLVNGLLVYWIVSLLFRYVDRAILSISPAWIGLCVATLWLIHPINIIPVMLVVQRMTLLSGTFLLLAMICHLTAVFDDDKNKISYLWLALGWLFFWPLSVLSKESGVLFPFYALMMMLLINTVFNRSINKYAWRVVVGISILLILIALWVLIFRWNWIEAGYAMRSFSISERLMTESRVLWFYIRQIVLPDYFAFGIYLDDIAISHGLLQPVTTLPAILGWIVSIWIMIKYWRRYPLPCFGLSWFIVGHLLESTFLPLEIAHEHRNYIPSVGIIIGLVWFGLAITQKVKASDKSTFIQIILAVAVISCFSLITALRANQLGDPIMGPQLEAQRHPLSARANYEAATTLIKAGFGHAKEDPVLGRMIKEHFLQAGAVNPTFKLGYVGLIVWSCASDMPVESQWVDELMLRLKTVPMGPADISLPKSIGDPVLAMPRCLSRQQVEQLFEAGANNTTAVRAIRASFLEWLADYELAVNKDIKSTKTYLAKALTFTPYAVQLKEKLKVLDQATSGEDIKIEMHE